MGVLTHIENGVATITIDRPEARNALDKTTIGELRQAFDTIREDDSAGVVIITGGGDKAFVSGADIKDLQKRTRFEALAAAAGTLFTSIEKFEKPVIAAINGFALGGGCELALACDIRIAAEHAKFGFPEVGLGIIPGAGGTQRLPRLLGLARAKELILTGDIIDAQKALHYGLVSQVVGGAELLAAARAWADKMLAKGPLALRLAKAMVTLSARVDLDSGLVAESLSQAILFESADKLEGTTAFIEKRKPRFTGR